MLSDFADSSATSSDAAASEVGHGFCLTVARMVKLDLEHLCLSVRPWLLS